MKRFFGFSALLSLLFVAALAGAADIKLMTQNQYLGADLTPLFAAPDAAAFDAQIAKEEPALVGLQEVYQFQCTGPGCSDPSIAMAFSDHLQATLDALDGAYVEKATVVNFSVSGVPFFINGASALVSVVDRDVILAREGIDATPVDYTAFQGVGICLKPSGDGCNYSFVLSASTPLGSISVERGFVAVDATVDGKEVRLVNTHLEQQQPDPTNPLSQVYQAAQAAELLQVLLHTTPPERSLVVLGDMNSSPEHPAIPGPLPLPDPFQAGIVTPYQQFAEAGYWDAWTLRPGGIPGDTCCQLEDLSNQQSALYERIDMIFSRETPGAVKKARVVGATTSDKKPPAGLGLWPSDHGSLSAELQD